MDEGGTDEMTDDGGGGADMAALPVRQPTMFVVLGFLYYSRGAILRHSQPVMISSESG